MNQEKRLWNLSDLEAFGLNRATIRKRLRAVGIEPIATGPKNAPLYDLIQVAPHLCQRPQKQTDAPDLMGFPTAAELRAYIQAQTEKMKFMQEAKETVSVFDYENQIGICIAAIKGFKDKVITRIESTIPGVTPAQLEEFEHRLNFDLEAVSDELENI